jgi:hypothetical protein
MIDSDYHKDYDYSKHYGIAGQIANKYYRAVSHSWQTYEGTTAERLRRQIEGQHGRLLAAWTVVKEREHEIGGFIDNKVTLPGLNDRIPALEDLLAQGKNKNSIWNDPLKILFNDGSGFVLSHPHLNNDPAIENLYPPGTFSRDVEILAGVKAFNR